MQTYEHLVELAHICAKNAHNASMPDVARELWKMAKEYQRKAAALDSGKLPDIGPAPSFIKR
jgi:hypothetical protein